MNAPYDLPPSRRSIGTLCPAGLALGNCGCERIALLADSPVAWAREPLGTVSAIQQRGCSAQLNLCHDSELYINHSPRVAMQILVERRQHQVLTPNRFLQSKFLSGLLAFVSWFETGYFFITRTSRTS